jgi:hypothetical protein
MHAKKKTAARSSGKQPSQGVPKPSEKPARKKVKSSTMSEDHQAYAALDFVPEHTVAPLLPSSATTSNQSASNKAGKKAEKRAMKNLEKLKAAEKGKEKAKQKKKAKRARQRSRSRGSNEGQSSDQDKSGPPGLVSDSDSDSNSDSDPSGPPSSDEEPVKKTRKRKPFNAANPDLSKLSNHTPKSVKLLRESKKRVEAQIYLSNAFPSLTDSTTSGSDAWKTVVRANKALSRGGK